MSQGLRRSEVIDGAMAGSYDSRRQPKGLQSDSGRGDQRKNCCGASWHHCIRSGMSNACPVNSPGGSRTKTFPLTAADSARLRSAYYKMDEEGRITRHVRFEAAWATYTLIIVMRRTDWVRTAMAYWVVVTLTVSS